MFNNNIGIEKIGNTKILNDADGKLLWKMLW